MSGECPYASLFRRPHVSKHPQGEAILVFNLGIPTGVSSFPETARRSVRAICLPLCALFVLALVICSPARADVGVVLNESLDTSVARITGSGHSAVYFSRICPDGPVKLRLCHPGEQGSVLSNYISLGEDPSFEWNIAPLNVYVYGVTDSRNRPVFGSEKIKNVLEERYRQEHLADYCDGPCVTSNKAEWKEMVGADISRSMYIFVVETTEQQDLEIIAKFNALPNENHFNGFSRNCADFTREVINTYFPHATHRDYVNDFGMTSPKAIAHSFTRYALKHPDARFRVLHFAQLPGTVKRSSECRSGTEQLYHSKKLLVPMLLFADHELPVVAASYVLTGRFNPEHELQEHPSAEATEIDYQLRLAKSDKDTALTGDLEVARQQEQARFLGTPQEWKQYRAELDTMIREAVEKEIIPDRAYLTHVFKRFDEAGTPLADHNGAMWMTIPDNGRQLKVGISASTILAHDSDPRLSYQLLLEHVDRVLKSPKHSRETMPQLKDDWALLQRARDKALASNERSTAVTKSSDRASTAGGVD
jgi:hypothetical protein